MGRVMRHGHWLSTLGGLLVVVAGLAVPSALAASRWQLVGSASPSTSSNTWQLIDGGRYHGSGAGAAIDDQTMSMAGTLSTLRVKLDASPGTGKSYVFTVVKNDSSTSMACTISDLNTTCTYTASTLSVATNDTLQLLCTPSGTPNSATATWSVAFDSTTTRYTGLTSKLQSNFTTNYGFAGGNAFSILSDVECPVPTAGSIRDLYVNLNTAPGGTETRSYWLTKNGASQSLTCTVSGAATTCTDTTHTTTVAAGDRVAITTSASAAPAVTVGSLGVVFVPDVEGEWILKTSPVPSTTSTTYGEVNDENEGATVSESLVNQMVQATTIKAMYVKLASTPGGSGYVITLRKNGVDTALTCTVGGAGTTCNVSATVTAADNDYLTYSLAPSGSPTSAPAVGIGLLLYNPTRRRVMINEDAN